MKNELLEFALLLAQAAEAEIMPRFRACAVEWKPDGSEVTDADRRAEDAMRALIAKHTPAATVLGEEYGGSVDPASEPAWILDPIDGTASFAVGLPTFGTLIGYIEQNEPAVGIIHMPAMGETVYAAKAQGCWLQLRECEPRRVETSQVEHLRDAYVSAGALTGSELDPRADKPAFRISGLMSGSRRFRFIEGPVQYALLAQGRIDVAFDPRMHPWDIAALVPCMEEAGGVVSDLEGRRDGIVWRGNMAASAGVQLHREVLSVMQRGK